MRNVWRGDTRETSPFSDIDTSETPKECPTTGHETLSRLESCPALFILERIVRCGK